VAAIEVEYRKLTSLTAEHNTACFY